ncbi:MAG: YraN family protein [Parvibaculum sp.]|uniref:YraN family protein n=1 Tax=Parvibaculum sp. TaxID=2024848 RepID=UPI0027160562|nr:YraN family protein [Parvibaculum sp.]MDO8837520.1 YraN family protein [Parvibaculum sp.]
MRKIEGGMRKGDAARGRAAHRRGLRAETLAAFWLRLKGYRILARRLKTRAGEIDMVARRGRALVIVEVKASARPDRAGERAVEALLPRQQQRLARAADHLLAMRPGLAGLDLRFDVVLVAPRRFPRHLEDAWRP